MALSPAERVPLIASHEGDETLHAFLSQGADSIAALAKLSEVQIVSALPTDGMAPVQIVGNLKLMLHVEIDVEAEKARISKEVERISAEIAKCNAKLGNEAFVARAPEAVVVQEKARLTEFNALIDKLKIQLQQLG